MSLIYNATFDKNTRKLSFEDRAGNEIYSFTVPERVPVDSVTKPLTFKATQNGSSVTLKKNGSPTGDFQTSTDGGNTWADYTLGTAITLNTGDEVSFRAKADRTSEQSDKNYFSFQMTGKIEAWHNVMSLYRTNDFATFRNVVGYAFSGLFSGCTSLAKAPVLPATTLYGGCYSSMFNGCTSLVNAPALPATTLDNSCYKSMFQGCTSLVNAPALPATTLSYYCYNNMFNGCTSLTEVPELPATTLADSCYNGMFYGCTSLVNAPALPATTLSNYCYKSMFQGCTSLTKAHEFTATALANYCYYDMFNGCTSLTKAPALPVTTLAEGCYGEMFYGCTSLSEAPELPATTLITACYSEMFSGCTSLTKAPGLPSTKLANRCYQRMFKGCTSLTKAPDLPATTLANNCYVEMFSGCSSLNEVRCNMPSSYSSSDISSYTASWLLNVSSTGTFYTNYDANWPSGVSGIPTGWTRVNEGAPTVDDKTKPLTFKATQDGSTVSLRKNGSPTGDFQTSTDGGNTWADYTLGTAITLNTGNEVSFRAKADRTSDQDAQNYFHFEMTGKIEAWHNVVSLYRTNDFSTYDTAMAYSFSRLFKECTSLTKAPALPATTLADYCYSNMFSGCTSLTEAPELPATTLVQYCYSYMFYGCASLVNAPVLPATTLAQYCYRNMFSVCTSLTKAPALPATTLVQCCYFSMFYGCTSLTKAPELPVTTLAVGCYKYMFYGCTSLTKAPALPATTLIDSCYEYMFNGCTSLTKAPELSATTLANYCYNNMFNGCSSLNEVRCQIPSSYSSSQISSYAKDWLSSVASTGTFYTNADANWPSSSASGIPTGWTRVNEGAPAVDDITKPLTFRATQDGSKVTLKKYVSPTGDFQTSRDGGNTWSDYTIDTAITLNTGDEVSFRAKADRTSAQSDLNYFYFAMTGKIEAWHNVMSLYRTSDFATYGTTVSYAFYRLFKDCTSLTKSPALSATILADVCYGHMFEGCTSLTKAPELPATTLTDSCYSSMFYGCTSLTEAPALPSTGLALQCYKSMFEGCTSLTKAPVLPATTLADRCYSNMFYGCTSLVNAPKLPATTLTIQCYQFMFSGCTSLTEAPELTATKLANRCYQYMFNGCTSLTKAPELPATTLAQYCYQKMFYGCSILNEVRCQMPSTISTEDIPTYTGTESYAWLSGVASTGTFYTNADANWPSGASGIPAGWTRVPEVDPPVSDITKPLTFRATQNGSTVKLTKIGSPEGANFQTSRDGGNTWTDYTIGTAISLNTGDEVSFRAKADREFEQSDSKYFQFNMTGKIEAWHNVMSLYRTSDFATYESVMSFSFYYLFKDCTSLTKAPRLPATILAKSCYRRMFDGCTSLTEAPYLPATALAETCYWGMFSGCTSLTEVPVLQATRLGTRCYNQMFSGCSSLNEVHCYIPSSYSTEYVSVHADGWLLNVASTGTFHTNADANWSSGSASGIPEGWTRVNG